MGERKWQQVRSYSTALEAEMVHAALEHAGIRCTLKDANTVAQDWLLSAVVGGVKLMVPPDQVPEALAFLEAADTQAANAPLACPLCDSTDIEERGGDGAPLTIFKVVAVLLTAGLALFLKGYRYQCRSCRRRWG